MKQCFLLFCAGLLVPAFALANEPTASGENQEKEKQAPAQFHEMTEVDITSLESIDVDQISVLGIHLGSTIPQARNEVNNRFDLELTQDKFNNNRFYLYDESQGGDRVLLAYMKWPHVDSTLDELILYPGIARYLKGQSKQLVSKATMNFEQGIGKNFLGYPLNKEVILDVSSLDLKHVAFFYKEHRYQVIKQVKKDRVKYSFGIFSNDAEVGRDGDDSTP